jgi:hypothetical protein
MEYINKGSGYEFGRSAAGDGSLSDLQNFAVKMPPELRIQTKYVDMKHFEKEGAVVYATFSEFLAINSYATTDAATDGLFQLDAGLTKGFFGFPDDTSGADINKIAAGFSPFGSFAQKLAIGKEGLSSVSVVRACRFYFQKNADGSITLYMPHDTPDKVGVSTFDENGQYSSGEYKNKADGVPEKIKEFSGDDPAVFGAVKILGDNCFFIDVPVIDATGRTLRDVDASIKLQTKTVDSDSGAAASPPSGDSSATTEKSADASAPVKGAAAGVESSGSGPLEIRFPTENILDKVKEQKANVDVTETDVSEFDKTRLEQKTLYFPPGGSEDSETYVKNYTGLKKRGYNLSSWIPPSVQLTP